MQDIPEPGPRELITACMIEECIRLYHMDRNDSRKALERDLADRFVEYLNSQFRLSLEWVCAPDESDRSGPAPDCFYADKTASLSVILEVKRLYDKKRMESEKYWERFSCHVENDLSRMAEGQFYMLIPHNLHVPRNRDVLTKVVQELKALRPGESADLASLPRVRGYRPPECCQSVTVAVVHTGSQPDFGPKYQTNLKKANDKLRPWHKKGSETFLLYDAREFRALSLNGVEDKWPRIAHMFRPQYPADPLQEDYSNIDHVIGFDLDADGIRAKSLYTHHECCLPGLKLPTEWGIPYPQTR